MMGAARFPLPAKAQVVQGSWVAVSFHQYAMIVVEIIAFVVIRCHYSLRILSIEMIFYDLQRAQCFCPQTHRAGGP